MRKHISGIVILALISMTIVLNLPGKSTHPAAGIRSTTSPVSLSDGEMDGTVGGMSFKCFLAVAGAGVLAATGPGFGLALLAAGVVVCECDKDFDRIFGTNFGEICNYAN